MENLLIPSSIAEVFAFVLIVLFWWFVFSKLQPKKVIPPKSHEDIDKKYREGIKIVKDWEMGLACDVKNMSMDQAAECADQVTKMWCRDVNKLNDIMGSDYDAIVKPKHGWNATAAANCACIAINSPEPYKSIAKRLYPRILAELEC